MKLIKSINSDIKLTVAENKEVVARDFAPTTVSEFNDCGLTTINGSIPGNFELDMLNAGLIQDPFYSTNPIKMQRYESMHLWYYTVFDADITSDKNTYLIFEGIDTVADIYLNGEKLGHAENMFVSHEFSVPNLKEKGNELVIHILPAAIYASKFKLPAICNGVPYNIDALSLRKSASSFGWDIMPRLVSGGIWKEILLVQKPEERIEDLYLFSTNVQEDGTAQINGSCYIESDVDLIQGYTLEISGVCDESKFEFKKNLFNRNVRFSFKGKFKLWYPKGYGEQSLYDITVNLIRDGVVKDSKKLRFGVRSVELVRTSTVTDKEGDFTFKINGKPVFIMGTNWVPLSAYHSIDKSRLATALEMLEDIGCNAVRCWGGNVYEDHEFFDFCDEKGIVVWQDFMMGCAIYPDNERFLSQMKSEAEFIVKKLRNHPSLILWAGDNECDMFFRSAEIGYGRNPNRNKITRELLSDIIFREDHTRPYLPSSPYIDDCAYNSGEDTSEDHLWGPRDYFKGEYYKTAKAVFASEIGYHGCPPVESLKKFVSHEKLWPPIKDGVVNDDWLAHCSTMELSMNTPYSYRVGLMIEQVKTLFGFVPEDLQLFSLLSMVSQAEAKKFFIESFRINKAKKSGIIWWNLLDGWPQISDAVVDYYFDKKLAYHYIKRSQQPICFIMDEPKDGKTFLYGVSDIERDCNCFVTVTDVGRDKLLYSANVTILSGESKPVAEIPVDDIQTCYYIEWEFPNKTKGSNHYYSNMPGLDCFKYLELLRKIGFIPAR